MKKVGIIGDLINNAYGRARRAWKAKDLTLKIEIKRSNRKKLFPIKRSVLGVVTQF